LLKKENIKTLYFEENHLKIAELKYLRKLIKNHDIILKSSKNIIEEIRTIKTENEIERIEGIFSSPDYYDKFAAQTKELNTQLEQAKMKIKNLFDRWEELEKINNSNI